MNNYNDLVLAGVRLLDEKGPPDWRDTLKKNATVREPFDNLNMAYGRLIPGDTSGCVLMHLYGSFSEGCKALGIVMSNASQYGFEICDREQDDRSADVRYVSLNSAWKAWSACV